MSDGLVTTRPKGTTAKTDSMVGLKQIKNSLGRLPFIFLFSSSTLVPFPLLVVRAAGGGSWPQSDRVSCGAERVQLAAPGCSLRVTVPGSSQFASEVVFEL